GVVGGVALYFGLRRLFDIHAAILRSQGQHFFHLNVEGLFAAARRLTDRIVAGGLRRSRFWLLLVSMALGAAPFLSDLPAALADPVAPQPLPVMGWILWAVLVAATIATVMMHGKRLTALIVIGAVGLMVSMAFVYLSAPDLAL